MKKLLAFLMIPFLFSCATITVNVYFPDKDVEAAYENIESGLDFDVVPKKDTAAATPKAKPKSKSRSAAFFGVTQAWADPKININAELGKMEEVQEAQARRKERIDLLGQLFGARLIGLGKDGLIARVPKNLQGDTPASPADFFEDDGDTGFVKFVAAENKDRKILVRGMAVATLRAMKKDEKDKDELANFIEDSGGKFAELQMKKVQEGWFYQDSDGKWKQVEPVEEEEEEKPAKPR